MLSSVLNTAEGIYGAWGLVLLGLAMYLDGGCALGGVAAVLLALGSAKAGSKGGGGFALFAGIITVRCCCVGFEAFLCAVLACSCFVTAVKFMRDPCPLN